MAATRTVSRPRAARRSRTRGSLSRAEIVGAGLRIAREDDLRRLTMERLGRELGVTGMAIYRHFRNKQELVDAILDHFVREADVTGHGTDPNDWRLWMRRTYHAMYRALADTPGVLPFVASRTGWRFGPAAIATLEATLGTLRDAGFDRREAAEVQTTSLALAIGWAMLESKAGDEPGPRAQTREQRRLLELRYAAASRGDRPHVEDSARELAAAAVSGKLFDRGIERYLDAVAPRAAPPKKPMEPSTR